MDMIYSLKDIDHAVSRAGGIIKASDLKQVGKANSLLRAARKRAREIRDDSDAQYLERKEAGYREGREQAEMEAFGRLLAEQNYLDTKLQMMVGQFAELVKSSVRTVIENFDDDALLISTVVAGMHKLRREGRLEIRLSPALADQFNDLSNKLIEKFGASHEIELIEDPDITPPNFIVESHSSKIVFSLGEKLGELEALIDTLFVDETPVGSSTAEFEELAV